MSNTESNTAPFSSISDPGSTARDQYLRLRDKAYRLLARREHSASELRRKLNAKPGYKYRRKNRDQYQSADQDQDQDQANEQSDLRAALIDRLLTELAEQGAQSDIRYAEQHCRSRYQNGRGPVKLRYELSGHGIDEATMERVMSEYEGKWTALAAEVRCRKFGEAAPTSYQEWAKQARFLQQRGFATEQIGSYQK